jgi:hypothetical protein
MTALTVDFILTSTGSGRESKALSACEDTVAFSTNQQPQLCQLSNATV